ncbi:MAG: RsmD family RNA methyltransferase [Longimicrobiales bacterium]|nr:RsmD family RNA methyltransferase [Longimicrobiales bacterium]
MRIVGGRWADRNLTSPGKRIRPTAEAVRVRWVESIGPSLEGARILELCAGTGAVGLEALSRGAARVDFVENHPAALHALKANIAALRARDATRAFKRDAVPFLERAEVGGWEFVFADPPYGSGVAPLLVSIWKRRRITPTFVLEHATDDPGIPPGARTLRLGDASLTTYRLG